MMQTVVVKGSRLMTNVPSIETRAREIASITDKARFAELVDELIGEVAEKPRHLERVLTFIPPRRLIDAIVFFGEKDNSLVFALPPELTMAAILQAILVLNAPEDVFQPIDGESEDDVLDVSPPVGIDRRERSLSVVTKQAREAANETRRDIYELGEEMLEEGSGNTQERLAGRGGEDTISLDDASELRDEARYQYTRNDVLFDDVPELRDETPRRMSSLADQILDFRPVLTWWSLLKHRADAEAILKQQVFSKGVAVQRLTLRDLLLIAIWQEESFPEDVDDVPDAQFEAHGLGLDGDIDKLRHRLFPAIISASNLRQKHLEAVRDEAFEALGALLPAFSAPGFSCWGFFRRIEG